MEYLIRDFQESDIDQLIILCTKHAAHEQADYDPKDKADVLKMYCSLITLACAAGL